MRWSEVAEPADFVMDDHLPRFGYRLRYGTYEQRLYPSARTRMV